MRIRSTDMAMDYTRFKLGRGYFRETRYLSATNIVDILRQRAIKFTPHLEQLIGLQLRSVKRILFLCPALAGMRTPRLTSFCFQFSGISLTPPKPAADYKRSQILNLLNHVLASLSIYRPREKPSDPPIDRYNAGVIEYLCSIIEPESLAMLLLCEQQMKWFYPVSRYHQVFPPAFAPPFIDQAIRDIMLQIEKEHNSPRDRQWHPRARLLYAGEFDNTTIEGLLSDPNTILEDGLLLQKMPEIKSLEDREEMSAFLHRGNNPRKYSLKEIARIVGAPLC